MDEKTYCSTRFPTGKDLDEALYRLKCSPVLPTPATEDAGKFLRVVDGEPVWVALTDVSQVGV